MNLSEPIWRNCHAFPEHVAIVASGNSISYAHLYRQSAFVAHKLIEAGIGRGDVVAIGINSKAAYLLITLAIARIGAVASPLSPAWPENLKETILVRHGVKCLIQLPGDSWRSRNPSISLYLNAEHLLEFNVHESTPNIPVAADMGDSPWYLSLTSGSTGTPKTIVRTHQRELLLGMSYPEWGREDQSRVLVLISPQLAFSLGAMWRALINGRTLILCDPGQPADFFAAVERDNPTMALTSTGNAAQLVTFAMQHLPDAKARCSSLQTFAMGGGEASNSLLNGVQKYICDRYEIRYASSECGMLALANNDTLAARPQMRAGRLMPWVTAEVVDDNDQVLPFGQPGALRFRTPFAIPGYWNDEETTKRLVRDGWVYSGDVGVLRPAGYLQLIGRVDDRINLGGNKVDPVRIENIINSHPSVIESAVVKIESPEHLYPMLTAAIVLTGDTASGAEVALQEIRDLTVEKLEPASRPGWLIKVNALPKNAGGKVMRQQLAAELSQAGISRKQETH